MNEMYIGLDIGGTNMVAGLTNGAGKIINKVSRPVNKAWDPAELCRQSAQLAQQAAEVGGFAADQIKAVGLGLPGLVDNKMCIRDSHIGDGKQGELIPLHLRPPPPLPPRGHRRRR